MKNSEMIAYLQIAGFALAGFVAYRVYKKVADTGASISEAVADTAAAAVETAKNVVTKDLNPASSDNIIYSSLPESFTEKVGNFLGSIFGPPMPDTSHVTSNVSTQGATLSKAIETSEAAKRKAAKDLSLGTITGTTVDIYADPWDIISGVNMSTQSEPLFTGGASGSW